MCAYVLFLVLFGCNRYLSVYRLKNMKITLLIRSQSRFQIGFTLCTCNAKRPDEIDFFQPQSFQTQPATKLKVKIHNISSDFTMARRSARVRKRIITASRYVYITTGGHSRFWLWVDVKNEWSLIIGYHSMKMVLIKYC